VEWIQGELAWEETTNLRRWEIGRRLAEIGDPRPGVGVIDGVPDILWRPIPGGSVEIEGHGKFVVAPFEMAAYPATFAQFRAFLEAQDGYGNKRWWKDLKREDPNPAWESTLANHPVTHVSWFDATAFCGWLSARLGREVRLPDEWEWQQAAQSGSGYEYPWGAESPNGRANTRESDIQHTTAVGMFPQGDSDQKVSDLAGNVWEWCRNKYRNPTESGAGDDTESRVLRGGSWRDGQDIARAVSRSLSPADYRYRYVGFRVVVSFPMETPAAEALITERCGAVH
jgi:formylglycine-generating enzyme required for sulfatase activity